VPTSGGGGDTTAPSAPSGLAVTGTTSSSVSLSWTASSDNVGVTAHDVYRGTTLATTVSGNSPATTATVSGLAASTSYTFTVKARDAAGNTSPASNAVTATTPPASSSGAVKAQYRNYDTTPGNNEIKPGLSLVNTGSTGVALSSVTIRYWFTGDAGAATYNTWCDYALIGCGNITERVVALATPRTGGRPLPGGELHLGCRDAGHWGVDRRRATAVQQDRLVEL
jgi:hypothetical protein